MLDQRIGEKFYTHGSQGQYVVVCLVHLSSGSGCYSVCVSVCVNDLIHQDPCVVVYVWHNLHQDQDVALCVCLCECVNDLIHQDQCVVVYVWYTIHQDHDTTVCVSV